MDNDYNRINKIELEKVQARNLLIMMQGIKDLNAKLDNVMKELRTVREELRNVGKLRPLRSTGKPEEILEPQVAEGQTEISAK